jgi:hypothetical protein
MKNCLRVLVFNVAIAAWSHLAVAQIPNPGFEQWTAGNPVGWSTNNIPGIAVPITQSSTRHSGSFSAQAAVVTFSGSPFSPILFSQFPVSQRHANLTFWFEFASVGGDGAVAEAVMYNNQTPVGAGAGETFQSTAWQLITIPIEYFSTDAPDTCIITFLVTGDSLSNPPHVGSTARLDDIAFSGIVSVQGTDRQPLAFKLGQNYPNPFNPTTTISYQLSAQSHVTLKVYDVLGNEVATLADGFEEAGEKSVQFNATNIAGGVYFYRLQAGDFVASKKLLLLK